MSFRFQINLLFFFITLSLGAGSLWFFKTEQEKVIELNMQSQAKAITTLVSEDLAKMVYLDDPDLSTDITRRIHSVEGLYAAYFFDLNNEPLLIINSPKHHELGHSIAIDTQISFEDHNLGKAQFIFDNSVLANEQTRLTQFAITLFSLLIFTTLLLTHYLDKNFIRRLSELSFALKKSTEEQNFDHRLSICKRDEIGKAREHFNNLVTMVKEYTEQLAYEARHDVLTGLYNRYYLQEKIKDSIQSGNRHALCYIDLDQFKIINDTLGHAVGDKLLQEYAHYLLTYLITKEKTLLARTGGDEFVLLMEQTEPSSAQSLVYDLIEKTKEFEFIYGERKFRIGLSAGMIYFDTLEENPLNISPADILSAADTACHQAKAEGRDKLVAYRFGDQNLIHTHDSMNLVSTIRAALETNRFELYLQPIVPSRDLKQVSHYETLLRLIGPGNEIISPVQFIPVAEQYGLVKKIDLWVVSTLLQKLRAYPEFSERVNFISINLSAESLMDVLFKEELDQLLNLTQIPLSKLCFEVTETGSITDFLTVRDFIEHFKKRGCSFALDDFGTGMASFEYLSQLPVDFLKIDGSFVKQMASDPVMKELVIAMNQIGHITQTKVIAEYVENQELVESLTEIGVDYLQGYFFSVPRPLEDFAKASK